MRGLALGSLYSGWFGTVHYAAHQKLFAKVDNNETQKTLHAHNSRPAGNGDTEHLHIRGAAVYQDATATINKLGLVRDFVEGLECSNECDLKYSPDVPSQGLF